MNKKRFWIMLLMSIFMLVLPVQAAKLNYTRITMTAGYTMKLKVTGTNKKVKWSTSNARIATVSKTGKVKGIKPGKATVTAKVGKKKYRCAVTVKKAPNTPFTLSLNRDSLTLRVGGTFQLKATCTPAVGADIVWSSGNSSVATVSKNGLITARGEGETEIKASARKGQSWAWVTCGLVVVAKED